LNAASSPAPAGERASRIFQGLVNVVVPAKAGTQCLCNPLKTLGSGFRRNDEVSRVQAFLERHQTVL
jgi:hypothetical protein